MREILFRGKRVSDCEWVYGYYVEQYGAKEIYLLDGVDWECGLDHYSVIPETVGQYTGLTDSEGNKIFEGDVIKYADKLSYDCYIEQQSDYIDGAFDNLFHYGEVEYGLEYGYPAFDLSYHHFESNGLQELSESGDWHYVVIGNIHDREL